MRLLPLTLLLNVLILAACNGEIYLRDGVTDGDAFFVSPYAAANPDPVVQSWIRYSLSRSVCQLRSGNENPARVSSFECERAARQQLVDAWLEHRSEHPALRDAYLDELVIVGDAGFLDEYTVHHFGGAGWTVPDELDTSAYHRWRRRELRGHRAETRIIGAWGYREAARR